MTIYTNTTIFDFETTGLSPKNDRVIEVAAIRIRNGKVAGVLSHLINPEMELPENITELTGITHEELIHAPTMKQFLPWLLSFMGDSLLVAHNALFDLSFLEEACQLHRGKSIQNSFIDTRALCTDYFPYKKNTLGAVCERLGIPLEGAHRALNDIEATWKMLQELDKIKGSEWTQQYVNKLYYFKKYGAPEWLPDYANVIAI